MRKIFTLLSLLLTTVVAMATSYNDALNYSIMGNAGSNPSHEVTIESTGDNLYKVVVAKLNTTSALGAEVGSVTFNDVQGTTADGLTTIEATDPAMVMGDGTAFSSANQGELTVKFTAEKAYVAYTGKIKHPFGSLIAFSFTFGTDEFSTGGGGTTPSEPTCESMLFVYGDMTTSLSVDGGEPEVLTSSNESMTLDDYTDGSHGVTIDDVKVGNAKDELGDICLKNLKYNEGTSAWELDPEKEYAVTVNVEEGSAYNGVVFKVVSASIQEYVDGDDPDAEDAEKFAYGVVTLQGEKDGKKVDVTITFGKDPNAFEPETEEVNGKAVFTYNGQTTNMDNATVVLEEYEEDVYKLTVKDVTVSNGLRIGDFNISNVTATTDEATGVATLSTDVTSGTWTNVNAESGLSEGMVSAFTGFEATAKALAGEGDDLSYSLSVKYDISFGFGKIGVDFSTESEPVTPTEPTRESATYVYGDMTTSLSVDGGEPEVLTFSYESMTLDDYSDGSHGVTIEDVKVGRANDELGDICLKNLKYDEEASAWELDPEKENTVTVNVEEGSAYNGVVFKAVSASIHEYVDGDDPDAEDAEKFAYGVVTLQGEKDGKKIDVTITFGKDPNAFEPETEEVNGKAVFTYNGQATTIDNATVEIEEYEEDVFKLTMKDITVSNGLRIGDFNISNVTATADEATGVVTLYTDATSGTWTNVNADTGLSEGMESAFSGFEATAKIVGGVAEYLDGDDDDDDDFSISLAMKYDIAFGFGKIGVSFGEKEDGVNGIAAATSNGKTAIFSLNGMRMKSLQKGVNVLRTADGKTMKIVVK